ncbi:MAG: hypothetical protein Q9174_003145 [Haloplaca sp. 1 TL-2023]
MYGLMDALFTSLLIPHAFAAPQDSSTGADSGAGENDLMSMEDGSYICLHKTTFPLPPTWQSFEELSTINQQRLGSDSDNIIKAIKTFDTSPNPSVNAEQFQSLILALVVQESGGKGDVVSDKRKSFGLLQVQLQNEEKPVTCTPGSCTYDDYLKMLQQGVNGHIGTAKAEPPGIAFWLAFNSPGAALRSYNTGSLPDKFDYGKASPTSTESYVSDLGNRLAGVSPERFPDANKLQQMCGFVPGDSS